MSTITDDPLRELQNKAFKSTSIPEPMKQVLMGEMSKLRMKALKDEMDEIKRKQVQYENLTTTKGMNPKTNNTTLSSRRAAQKTAMKMGVQGANDCMIKARLLVFGLITGTVFLVGAAIKTKFFDVNALSLTIDGFIRATIGKVTSLHIEAPRALLIYIINIGKKLHENSDLTLTQKAAKISSYIGETELNKTSLPIVGSVGVGVMVLKGGYTLGQMLDSWRLGLPNDDITKLNKLIDNADKSIFNFICRLN